MATRTAKRLAKHLTEPECAADGKYESIQCESSGRWCWCVDDNGKKVGFGKKLKKLNCSSIGKGEKQTLCGYNFLKFDNIVFFFTVQSVWDHGVVKSPCAYRMKQTLLVVCFVGCC